MRWVIFAGILIVVTGGGYYLYRSTHGGYEGAGAPARMDQGVPVQGEGRIDPHANVGGAKAGSPLRVVSRLLGSSSVGAQIDVEVSTFEPFTSVRVEVERFDQANALSPAWKSEIWSGALQPSAAHRVQVNVPLGAQPPVRILISAHAQSPAGARFGAMDIVDLGKHGATPPSQPAPTGGAIEYPGHADSAHARP
jgi:hypothetical protein